MKCCEFTVDLEADPLKDPGTYEGATTNRKCTDIIPLILTLLYFGLVGYLMGYCISYSDVDKYLKGYDDCGNICGRNNTKTKSIPFKCFGKNMLGTATIIAYDSISGAEKRCASNCPFKSPYCALIGSDEDLMPIHLVAESRKLIFILTPIIAILIIAFIQCCLIQRNLTVINFISNHFIFIALFTTTLLALVILFTDYQRKLYYGFYVFIIILEVISILYLLFICPFYRSKNMGVKIGLTAEFLATTSKILRDLKFSGLLRLINIILISLLFYGWYWCNIYVSTYSYLDEADESMTGEKIYDYFPYAITIATKILLICTALFLYEFIRNVQFMLISGTIARWYFTQNKTDLSSPFKKTLINIFKYHFGTLCFCSFILTITFPIQILINFLSVIFCLTTTKHTKMKFFRQKLSENCYRILNGVLTYLTRNGLTMTAIHGLNFCAATTRASKLLAQNQFNIATIFYFGDWIFVVARLSVSCLILCPASFLIVQDSFCISHLIAEIIIVIWICVFSDCWASAFSITQYTLFMCSCEDFLYNKYHMTPELAQYIENVNMFVDEDYWKKVEDKWAQGPKKLY